MAARRTGHNGTTDWLRYDQRMAIAADAVPHPLPPAVVDGVASRFRALAEPMRDRLFFAGEATHETLWGTVNGAWESGERAAEGVLRRLGVLKDPVEPKPAQRPQRKRS